MARTVLTRVSLPSIYEVAAGTNDFVPEAVDITNGNEVLHSGAEVLIVQNSSGTTPYTVTLESPDCSHGRTEDLVYTLQANDFAMFFLSKVDGWTRAGNLFYLDAENAAVKVSVILPA